MNRMTEICEHWRRIGLSCEPADFPTGDWAICNLYRRLGYADPVILHVSSPAMGQLAISLLHLLSPHKAPIGGKKRKELDDWVLEKFPGAFGEDLFRTLRDQVGCQWTPQIRLLAKQFEGKIRWHPVLAALNQLEYRRGKHIPPESELWGTGFAHTALPLRQQLSQLNAHLRGQLVSEFEGWRGFFVGRQFPQAGHGYARLAFLHWGREHGADYQSDGLAMLSDITQIAESVGPWAAYYGICVVSDRPRRIRFDSELRLHCETEKAVEFSDGWGVSAWRGTRIPYSWLVPETRPDSKTALSWEDIEQRRAAIDMLGWHSILSETSGIVIDEAIDPQQGLLVEVRLPDLDEPARFLRAQCGTKREFAICVPPHVTTVCEAQAWLTALPDDEFRFPRIRT